LLRKSRQHKYEALNAEQSAPVDRHPAASTFNLSLKTGLASSNIHLKGGVEICRDDHVFLTGDEANDRAEIGRFSSRDYDVIQRFDAMLEETGAVISNQWLREPPSLQGGFMDLLGMLKAGRDMRGLPVELRHRLLQMFTNSAADIIERWFESPMVRSMYASHCVSGNNASFYHPGSAIPFFHHALGNFDGQDSGWGLARGGMGQIAQAMASFARSKGVEIRTDAAVDKIVVENGRVKGVRLAGGEEISGRAVLSNADPKRTFLKLVDAEHLPTSFVEDIKHLRMGHASLRMNLALDGLPVTQRAALVVFFLAVYQ